MKYFFCRKYDAPASVLRINIAPVDDLLPSVSTSVLHAIQGTHCPISPTNFLVRDRDTSDDRLVVTVQTAPTNGVIQTQKTNDLKWKSAKVTLEAVSYESIDWLLAWTNKIRSLLAFKFKLRELGQKNAFNVHSTCNILLSIKCTDSIPILCWIVI